MTEHKKKNSKDKQTIFFKLNKQKDKEKLIFLFLVIIYSCS